MIQGTQTTKTIYLDGFQYKNNRLEFFPTPEGYVNVLDKYDSNYSQEHLYDYVYNYTDHLGNIRLSYTDANRDGIVEDYWDPLGIDNVKEILEENHYYPFGLKHNYNNTISKYKKAQTNDRRRPKQIVEAELDYKYMYNGKELQDELGLDWYDYGARNYDAAIGRWMNVDPLAEKYPGNSPYMYTANNPVKYSDPNGMDYILTITQNEDGSYNLAFSTTVFVNGKGAEDRVKEYNEYFADNKDKLNGTFTYTNENGEEVTSNISFDVTYAVGNEGDRRKTKGSNLLNLSEEESRSHVELIWNKGTLYSGQQDSGTAFHETLHFFGFSDRYDDYNSFGETLFSDSHEGYDSNPMGNSSNWSSLSQDQYNYIGNTALKANYGDFRYYRDGSIKNNFGSIYGTKFEQHYKETINMTDGIDIINDLQINPIIQQ